MERPIVTQLYFTHKKPTSFEEAEERLSVVETELSVLNKELAAPERAAPGENRLLTPEEHEAWKSRALGAQRSMLRERAVCLAYIKRYRREMYEEEQEEKRRSDTLLAIARNDLQRSELELKRTIIDMQIRHILTTGSLDTAVPIDANAVLAVIAKQKNERKRAHLEWLKLISKEEPIVDTDPANLLRHALRLLRQLSKDNRVSYTQEEKALLNVIDQHELVSQTLEMIRFESLADATG